MAKSLSVYVLGVGDAFTTEHFFSNVMLTVDGRDIFIDVPALPRRMFAYNNEHGVKQLSMENYREIIMTHMHGDHYQGLEEVAYLRLFSSEGRVKLYAPDWMFQQIWGTLAPSIGQSHRGDYAGPDDPDYWYGPNGETSRPPATLDWYYDPVPLRYPHDMGGFVLESMPALHVPYTLSYKFDFGNYKVGYSADTALNPKFIAWMADCDIVLHECAVLGSGTWPGGDLQNIHTTLDELLTLPKEFQKKTHLYHYPDTWRDFESKLGGYRFLKQNKLYELVRDGQKVG